jgi:hypothetical protein
MIVIYDTMPPNGRQAGLSFSDKTLIELTLHGFQTKIQVSVDVPFCRDGLPSSRVTIMVAINKPDFIFNGAGINE